MMRGNSKSNNFKQNLTDVPGPALKGQALRPWLTAPRPDGSGSALVLDLSSGGRADRGGERAARNLSLSPVAAVGARLAAAVGGALSRAPVSGSLSPARRRRRRQQQIRVVPGGDRVRSTAVQAAAAATGTMGGWARRWGWGGNQNQNDELGFSNALMRSEATQSPPADGGDGAAALAQDASNELLPSFTSGGEPKNPEPEPGLRAGSEPEPEPGTGPEPGSSKRGRRDTGGAEDAAEAGSARPGGAAADGGGSAEDDASSDGGVYQNDEGRGSELEPQVRVENVFSSTAPLKKRMDQEESGDEQVLMHKTAPLRSVSSPEGFKPGWQPAAPQRRRRRRPASADGAGPTAPPGGTGAAPRPAAAAAPSSRGARRRRPASAKPPPHSGGGGGGGSGGGAAAAAATPPPGKPRAFRSARPPPGLNAEHCAAQLLSDPHAAAAAAAAAARRAHLAAPRFAEAGKFRTALRPKSALDHEKRAMDEERERINKVRAEMAAQHGGLRAPAHSPPDLFWWWGSWKGPDASWGAPSRSSAARGRIQIKKAAKLAQLKHQLELEEKARQQLEEAYQD